eukprot:SAG31_NODE_190_length_20810_cov_20.296364_17_plen_78_part_00
MTDYHGPQVLAAQSTARAGSKDVPLFQQLNGNASVPGTNVDRCGRSLTVTWSNKWMCTFLKDKVIPLPPVNCVLHKP